MVDRVHNFSAGPSTLPVSVLEEVRDELLDYQGSGMSLVEMSHRGKHYDAVHREALELAASVFGAPDDFSVLFLQGGATLQFTMVPANLLTGDAKAGYVHSGSWARKAVQDGRHYGDAYIAWDGQAHGFDRMPTTAELELQPGTRYLHLTSNETIEGVRVVDWPEVDVPLVADMSSDFMSRPIPWDRFDVVYGGVQKNLGPAGMAVVFVRTSALDGMRTDIGAYLQYAVHAEKDSLYNTPPVFTVWMTGKVLRWIRDQGGLEAVQAAGQRKAATVYDVIDGGGFYRCPVQPANRSVTNVVFRLPSEELERTFVAEAAAEGMVGLKGHRSVGGCRASLYHAMPQAGAEALADFMRDFARREG